MKVLLYIIISHTGWNKGFILSQMLLAQRKVLSMGGYAMRHCCFCSSIFFCFYLTTLLVWSQVHYYCAQLLTYCTSAGWQMVMIVEQLVEWMNGSGNRVLGGIVPPTPLSTTDLTWPGTGWNSGRRCEKPVTNRMTYGTASSKLWR
jgi:hypothetical protein